MYDLFVTVPYLRLLTHDALETVKGIHDALVTVSCLGYPWCFIVAQDLYGSMLCFSIVTSKVSMVAY